MTATLLSLNHLSQQLVDSLLPITSITALNEMLKLALSPPPRRITQLERPQKVICLFKVGSDRENLMHQILHTLDSVFPECLNNESIVGEGDTRSVDFAVAAFVDEVTDGFEVWFAVGDV